MIFSFIYRKNLHGHVTHLNSVLNVLMKEKLFANLKKRTFFAQISLFFFVLLQVHKAHNLMSSRFAIQKWPSPRSVSHVPSFCGLACFDKRFIKNFTSIAAPVPKSSGRMLHSNMGEQKRRSNCLRIN